MAWALYKGRLAKWGMLTLFLIFKFVQGKDIVWKRFPILSYQNEKLEEFVKEIEERHTINTDQFWSWQTFD